MGWAGAHRNTQNQRICTEALFDFVECDKEIGPFAIHLVDESDPRHVVLVGLMPDGLALGLDALSGAENHHAAVQHAKAAFHLGGEIDVAGCVDKVYGDVLPREVDAGREDRYATLLLLGIGVGNGGAFVDGADAVAGTAVEEHSLGNGRFSGIDVGDNADVSDFGQIDGHGLVSCVAGLDRRVL